MGYTIRIGEASIYPSPDELAKEEQSDLAYWVDCGQPFITVRELVIEDAPAYDEYNPSANQSWPSYIAFHDSMRSAGLHDLFFDKETGLMREHPGTSIIRPAHAVALSAGITHFRQRFPRAVPRFEIYDEDATLARLLWLDWWFRWSLEHCRLPVIFNS